MKIELDEVKTIIEKKESEKLDNFISNKTGKPFSAKLKIEGDSVKFDFN